MSIFLRLELDLFNMSDIFNFKYSATSPRLGGCIFCMFQLNGSISEWENLLKLFQYWPVFQQFE